MYAVKKIGIINSGMIKNETDLYEPVKKYLEHQGYKVKAEVAGCDVVGERNRSLIVVELKKQFSVALLVQAVKRQMITDLVYIAIPVPKGKTVPPNYNGMRLLLKRLGIGLLLIHGLEGGGNGEKVEVASYPEEFSGKLNGKRKKAVLQEMNGRITDNNTGGSRSVDKKITLYRQNALQIALLLSIFGESTALQLKNYGTGKKTGSILNNNYYGWFVKIKRGLYSLSPKGINALKNYPELTSYYKDLFYQV